MAFRFPSFVPTINNGDLEDLGLYPITNWTDPGQANYDIQGADAIARWHWLAKDWDCRFQGSFLWGGNDGYSHGLTSAGVSWDFTLTGSRGTYASMDDLIEEMRLNSGNGNLFGVSIAGTYPLSGSHKYYTEPANDAVVGNYVLNYELYIGEFGAPTPVKVRYSGDALGSGDIYHLMFIYSNLWLSYEKISGDFTTGFPPGEPGLGLLAGEDAFLYAVPDIVSPSYVAGAMGAINNADPTNNPIGIGGTYLSFVNTGPDGDVMSSALGMQSLDVDFHLVNNLTHSSF